MGVWIPDGDGSCTNLLKFALNEGNFEHTMVAFVVSMSTPWNILESLKKWSTILRDHIKKLNLSESKRNEYMKQQRRLFQMYHEPDENLNNINKKTPNLSNSTPNSKLSVIKPNEKKPNELNDTIDTDDSLLLPLDPSILTKNLGIPIMVIVTKVI